MAANPLLKGSPVIDRSKWTLNEHCAWANAQLILKEIDKERYRKGLVPVHWVIRDGRVVLESK